MAFRKSPNYYVDSAIPEVQIQTDSLGINHMLTREWKIPRELIEKMEHIQSNMKRLKAEITHVFREINQLADRIVNEAFIHSEKIYYHSFEKLPVKARRILNIDKAQITTPKVRTRAITSSHE